MGGGTSSCGGRRGCGWIGFGRRAARCCVPGARSRFCGGRRGIWAMTTMTGRGITGRSTVAAIGGRRAAGFRGCGDRGVCAAIGTAATPIGVPIADGSAVRVTRAWRCAPPTAGRAGARGERRRGALSDYQAHLRCRFSSLRSSKRSTGETLATTRKEKSASVGDAEDQSVAPRGVHRVPVLQARPGEEE